MNIRRLTLFLMLVVLCIAGAEQASAFYNPGTGRWLSKDPIWESGGMNLYGAMNNNPIRYVDPSGLFSYDCCDKATRDKGAADLTKQYNKLTAGVPLSSLTNDNQGVSCKNCNGAVLAKMVMPTCWECHLENRQFNNNLLKFAWEGFVKDHWAIICTSVDEHKKIAETLIFDATGGMTGNLNGFRTNWPDFVGTEPSPTDPHMPCPKPPTPSPTGP